MQNTAQLIDEFNTTHNLYEEQQDCAANLPVSSNTNVLPYFLSQLLPYDTEKKIHGALTGGLKEYQLLLKGSLQAIEAFREGGFEKFDSLVGENACQIRAIYIIIIAKKALNHLTLLTEKIAYAQQVINNLLLDVKVMSRLMSGKISLKDILAVNSLDVTLTSEQMFIIEAYLLSEAKVSREKLTMALCQREIAKPKKLKVLGDVSSAFTYELLKKLRKLLAIASVQFIRDCALALEDLSLIKMVSDLFTITYHGWPCIPMFWTYKILLLIAQREKIPFVLYAEFVDENFVILDREYLFFETSYSKSRQLSVTEINSFAMDIKAICVIEGVVCTNRFFSKANWKTAISKHSLADIVLAGAADHRQYPDAEQDRLIKNLNNVEYENYKFLANNEGFSLTNPTMFFIQHVYAAQLKKYNQRIFAIG